LILESITSRAQDIKCGGAAFLVAMASRNDLLSSIRSFKKNNLAKADTVDKYV